MFPAPAEQDKRRSRRRDRGGLLDALNRVSSLPRCQGCGWRKSRSKKGGSGPEIAARAGVAYWRGVQRCGSIHACPVCAAKIRHGRALEISTAAAAWIDAGNEVYMVTLTSPHDVGDSLAGLLVTIATAFRWMISGRPWTRLRDSLGIVGQVRALEVTHGPRFGWHPHLHCLIFVRGQLDAAGRCQFELYFRDRWRKFITAQGSRPPSDQHGVRVERCYSGDGAADYICKTQEGKSPGNEMARADMKTARDDHRVPFQILESAAAGDDADLELWHAYEQASFGHQAITWSARLREIVREAAPERAADEDWLAEVTDQDLADVDVDGAAVARVDPEAMSQARTIPGFRVAVLEAYEDNGLTGLLAVAEASGFEVAWGLWSTVPLIVLAPP